MFLNNLILTGQLVKDDINNIDNNYSHINIYKMDKMLIDILEEHSTTVIIGSAVLVLLISTVYFVLRDGANIRKA